MIEPRFTIVVPTYRRDGLLVSSLVAHAHQARADGGELVVVVNGPAGGLASELASVLGEDGTRILQMPYNAGFGGGCRAGADVALSPYLIFSNDDFLPAPGWAASLVRRADQIGVDCIVGSTIVGFNGRVLDGAGTLDRRLGVTPRDRGRPLGSVLRQPATVVDFVTGCGLLISRSLFTQLRGFDPLFDPAYFEDVDLCLRARELHAPVVHEPSAWGLHREGLSEIDSRAAMFLRSELRFRQRWVSRPIPSPAHGNRRSWPLLVIDDRLPLPAAGSGFSRMYREVEGIAKDERFDIDFLALLHDEDESVGSTGINGVACVTLQDAITRVAKSAYSAVIVSRPHNIDRARRLIRAARIADVPVIYDAEALFHTRVEKLYELGDASFFELRNARSLDQKAVRAATAVISLNQAEAAQVARWKPDAVVALSVPASSLEVVDIATGPFRPSCVMLASWLDGDRSPNVEAVAWMAEHVMTLVRVHAPDHELVVTGSNPPIAVQALGERVSLVGTRPFSELFTPGAVSVCANRLQAGVSMKLLDSISLGIPVVATPECVASLPASVQGLIRSAAEPHEFAQLLLQLRDETAWREEAARTLIARAELRNLQRPVSGVVADWMADWRCPPRHSSRLIAIDVPALVGAPGVRQFSIAEGTTDIGEEDGQHVEELRLRLTEAEARARAIESSHIWKASAPVRRTSDLLRRRHPRLNAYLRSGSVASLLRRRLR